MYITFTPGPDAVTSDSENVNVASPGEKTNEPTPTQAVERNRSKGIVSPQPVEGSPVLPDPSPQATARAAGRWSQISEKAWVQVEAKVPGFVVAVIVQYWAVVVFLVSQVLYERMAHKYKAHFLVQFDQTIDLSGIEQGCAGYHKGTGRGSWTVHSVPQLVRVLLVKYLFNLSYRETEEKVDRDILVKYWCGYNLLQSPPDHTTIWRFEIWVLFHCPRLFFDEILRQIDEMFPEEQEQMQLVDTYAMLVRGAKTSLIELLRDVCRHILTELKKADPERYADVVGVLDMEALFGAEEEKITPALTPEEREVRLQSVVNEAMRLYRFVNGSLTYLLPTLSAEAQAPVEEWLGYLDKIIADETCLLPPDPNQSAQLKVEERPHGKKGQYRIACANDTDGTYRNHGKGKQKLAYNAAVLTSPNFVRETEVMTGSTPDPDSLEILLLNQYTHHGFFPPELCGDQIFGHGKSRALVDQISGGQTVLIALVPNYEKRTDRFVPADFSLLPPEEELGLICPDGVLNTNWKLKPDADGITFNFTAKMCRGCAFWLSPEELETAPDLPHCRKPGCKPNSRRQVFISDYRSYILAGLEYNQTEEFKLKMKQRSLVERIIYNLTNIHGGRRAKSTGLPKVNFQTRMVTTAFNIRQLLRLWPKKQAAARIEQHPAQRRAVQPTAGTATT